MITRNIFIQVAMIAISIGIIFTFVEPTFGQIGKLQDDIVVYQVEQQKVSSVNNQLMALVNVLNNVAPDDQRRLLTYMPDEVDTINVVRDLSLISEEAGVTYISAESIGAGVSADQREVVEEESAYTKPREYTFNLAIEGTYSQVKNLFMLLEQNNYPIEVQTLSIQKKDGGFLTAGIGLSVYAHEEKSAPNVEFEF